MKLNINFKLDEKKDVLVLGLFEGDKNNYASYNKELAKEIENSLKRKVFEKKFGEVLVTKVPSLPFQKIFVFGLGKKKEINLEKVRKIMGKTITYTKSAQFDNFTTNFSLLFAELNLDQNLIGQAVAEAMVLADYEFIKYLNKEKQEKKKSIKDVSLQWSKKGENFEKGLQIGKVIAESTNFARDLVNEPASVINSEQMEKEAKKLASEHSKLSVKVLEKSDLKKLGMNALLGVNAGSEQPPKLVILEYKGGSGKPTAFLGKGITFDSGGYNLKPTKYIEDMKTDMGGAAAVLGTMKVAAELNLKKNLLGVMPLCENMIGSRAQYPGDIVKAYNGKTIEIGNTDAEGRLILADSLAYIEDKYKPEVMIDLATLTGACVVALGYYAAALVGKDEKLQSQLEKAGEKSGDRVWKLPFYEEFQDWMDGEITDLNNISSKGKGYEAGTITAGVFLSKFVEKAKWAHIDIAGSACWAIGGDYLTKGATGSGFRVLSYWLIDN